MYGSLTALLILGVLFVTIIVVPKIMGWCVSLARKGLLGRTLATLLVVATIVPIFAAAQLGVTHVVRVVSGAIALLVGYGLSLCLMVVVYEREPSLQRNQERAMRMIVLPSVVIIFILTFVMVR